MEKNRKTAITNAEIDAMTNEELLQLAKTRGQYIDRWTYGFHEDHYCDRVLDVPSFLRRLIQVHPKQFTRTLAKLAYPNSAQWSAVALSQGLGVHNLSVLERSMPPKLARVEVKDMRGSGGPYQLVMEHSYSLSSALLLEVSTVARKIWMDQYPQYRFQKTRCDHLAKAMVMREYSHHS